MKMIEGSGEHETVLEGERTRKLKVLERVLRSVRGPASEGVNMGNRESLVIGLRKGREHIQEGCSEKQGVGVAECRERGDEGEG